MQAANCRPVSLTSQLSKLCELIIRDVLVEYLDKKKLGHDSQHGFRKYHSSLMKAKAFDKVPCQHLLQKFRAHAIGGKLLKWID